MRRSVGLAVAAVVLAVTLGVLVGLVIHTGMAQRANDPPRTTASTGSSEPSASSETGVTGSRTVDLPTPWQPSLTPVPDTPTGSSVASTESTGNPAGPAAVATTGSSSPATTSAGTASSTPATRTATVTVTASSTRSTTGSTATSTTATATTTRSGAQVPGGPCDTLGQRSATATGATLYCQHDQSDGALRWRPVTDGGGCLNRTMTGIGLDGRHYVCRTGPDGLNHWQPAG